MSEGENPNPARITEASWWFMQQLLALEPNTANAGIYVNKPGFHGTRAENIARSGPGGNYSIRHPLDLEGPDDKAAAYDWTHNIAHGGNYTSMAKYGDRLEAAFNARDPRLYGWHEAQGQTDTDKPPEELNFDDWTRGVPADSHSWHWHFSEHRAFVESWDNKECMLSVLRGESLADYLARGGRLMTEDDVEEQAYHLLVEGTRPGVEGKDQTHSPDGGRYGSIPNTYALDRIERGRQDARRAADATAAIQSALVELNKKVDALATGGVDMDALATKVADKLAERLKS